MTDPQLGFYASRHSGTEGIEYEIKNLSAAISMTNEIQPDFVITTGDLMQNRLDQQHADVVKKLYAQLNCKYYFAPGNSDLSNSPKFEDIERYKGMIGQLTEYKTLVTQELIDRTQARVDELKKKENFLNRSYWENQER